MLENWAKLSGFAAILAAVMAVSFLWALYYVPPQNAEWTCEAQQETNTPNNPSLKGFSCHTKQSEHLENQTAGAKEHGNQDNSDNVKITDVLLATFTMMLVIVTAILGVVGIGQGRELSRAVDASKDEFAATHRPQIRVKHVWLANDIWNGERVTVNLTFVNRGVARAILNEVGVRFIVVPKGGLITPFDPDIPKISGLNVAGAILPSGISWPVNNVSDGTVLNNTQNVAIHQEDAELICLGFISYLDDAEPERRLRITGFCRKLVFPPKTIARKDNSRFHRFDDREYEYED